MAQRTLPTISPPMAAVLQNVGLEMTEHLVHAQQRPKDTRPAFGVLLPGLARGCTSYAYMEAVMRTCSSGAADTTLLLQFANESKQSERLLDFSLCARNLLELGGKHAKCSFVFARQQYLALPTRPCQRRPGRVEMQTLSIGRVYELARHIFGSHRFYVRARLDDSSWCIPPVQTLPRGDAWIVVDGFGAGRTAPDGTHVRVFSDRYALVPARLAHVYFEAWRIWSKVDCTHPCHAGHGSVGWGASLSMQAWVPQGTERPYQWSPWSMVGECALTTWIETNMATHNITAYKAASGAGNGLFKMKNATHVLRGGNATAVEDWLRLKTMTEPPVHGMTAACRPQENRAVRQPLVKPPLPALRKLLSCEGRGVLGLCDELNISIDGTAMMEWMLLLLASSLILARLYDVYRTAI